MTLFSPFILREIPITIWTLGILTSVVIICREVRTPQESDEMKPCLLSLLLAAADSLAVFRLDLVGFSHTS